MRVVGPVVFVLVLLVASGSAVEAQEGDGGVAPSWLALGDSYASGEGISGTDPDVDSRRFHSKDCARANGNTDARAWAVVAYDEVWGAGERAARMWFTACTGHITDDWLAQVEEASFRWNGSEPVRVDVVTLSFGGNNILFADVIQGCLDLDSAWDVVTSPGCDVDLGELRYRIDLLAGNRQLTEQERTDGHYRGFMALPTLYDHVAELVNPGGSVFVAGYPQLVEETHRWDVWRRRILHNCEGILDLDVGMLRSAAGYLNEQIGRAVLAADARHPDIEFQFVDVASQVYETGDSPDQRHALCGEDPWLNGLTTGITSGDLRLFNRSFHPHQSGHTATGQHLAELLEAGLSGDTHVVTLTSSGLEGFNFGDEYETVVEALSAKLGPPDEDTGWVDPWVNPFGVCPGNAVRGIRWGDLQTLFVTGLDEGWTLGDRSLGSGEVLYGLWTHPAVDTDRNTYSPLVNTADGVGVGDPVSQVRDVYGVPVPFDWGYYSGWEFRVSELVRGETSGPADSDTVSGLYAGGGCSE